MENKNLCLVVPYRNREEHMKIFVEKMIKFINNINFKILIVHQFDEKPFNRAKLLNIGFDYAKNDFDYFCFHDIDMIPIEADYSFPEKPYHMAAYVTQFKNFLAPDYYGGVNIFNKNDFIKINGFSNEYWGWGAEDDDLLKRVIKNGFGLNRRYGRYFSLNHKHIGQNHDNYKNNLSKLKSNYNSNEDGLNTLIYTLVELIEINDHVTMINVKI